MTIRDATSLGVANNIVGYDGEYDVDSLVANIKTTPNPSDRSLEGLHWSNDGRKLYAASMIVGADTFADLVEFTATNPYDSSSLSESVVNEVTTRDDDIAGLALNNDGTKLYHCGRQNDNVYEYAMSTPFDMSTLSFTQSFSVGGQDGLPNSLTFDDTGSKMFVGGGGNDNIYEYGLSTLFDISTASFTDSFNIGAQDSGMVGHDWSDDGSKLHTAGATNSNVYEYTASTAYDVSTLTFQVSTDISGETTSPTSFSWDGDGSRFYVCGGGENIHEYVVGVAVK